MRPSKRRRVLFRVIDAITALFGGQAPRHWLSIVGQESDAGLAEVLTRAFGVPAVLTEALEPVRGDHLGLHLRVLGRPARRAGRAASDRGYRCADSRRTGP